jgi:hypothetical protein
MKYLQTLIVNMLTGGVLLSLSACADTASQNTAATTTRDEAGAAGPDGATAGVAPRADAVPSPTTAKSEPVGRDVRPAAAGPRTSLPRGGLVTSKKHLVVPGRVVRGTLSRRGGCIVVDAEGSVFTAVFPPTAKLISTANGGEAVSWPGRTIPLGELTRIPGGGSATRADLAAPLPPTCPDSLYAIGG